MEAIDTSLLKPARESRGFNTPLQQLLLLEERVRHVGATLPEDIDRHMRFHGIKCVMAGVNCMLNIRMVTEIIGQRHITPVPGVPDWVEGVINYRGALVPVYNTHQFLHATGSANPALAAVDGPLLVIRCKSDLCAIRVNKVVGMQKCLDDEFYRQAESAEQNPHSVFHYIDDCIGNEDTMWGRVEINRLLDVISRDEQKLPQAAAF